MVIVTVKMFWGPHCAAAAGNAAAASIILLQFLKVQGPSHSLNTMTFSNQKSPTKPAVEDGEAVIEEEDVRDNLDEVDGDIKIPHSGIRRISADSGNYCQYPMNAENQKIHLGLNT